jgi:hypothetical protein
VLLGALGVDLDELRQGILAEPRGARP